MNKLHNYSLQLAWTGNKGEGTSTYRAYDRSYTISINNKAEIYGSSDPVFRGDSTKHNPEEMMVAALSSCHLLSYLHVCAVNGIVVVAYEDVATGTMQEDNKGGGQFTEVVLNITVTITDISLKEKAISLHHDANRLCFIANSVNFPVKHNVKVKSQHE